MPVRQDLTQKDKRLVGAQLILSIPMHRDFSRAPAYWIEIYKTLRSGFASYHFAKQWSFTRRDTGDRVEEFRVFPSQSLGSILKSAENLCAEKIEAGWLMLNVDPEEFVHTDSKEESKIILNNVMIWKEKFKDNSALHQGPRVEIIRKEKKLTPAEQFKQAQNARKGKADW